MGLSRVPLPLLPGSQPQSGLVRLLDSGWQGFSNSQSGEILAVSKSEFLHLPISFISLIKDMLQAAHPPPPAYPESFWLFHHSISKQTCCYFSILHTIYVFPLESPTFCPSNCLICFFCCAVQHNFLKKLSVFTVSDFPFPFL